MGGAPSFPGMKRVGMLHLSGTHWYAFECHTLGFHQQTKNVKTMCDELVRNKLRKWCQRMCSGIHDDVQSMYLQMVSFTRLFHYARENVQSSSVWFQYFHVVPGFGY